MCPSAASCSAQTSRMMHVTLAHPLSRGILSHSMNPSSYFSPVNPQRMFGMFLVALVLSTVLLQSTFHMCSQHTYARFSLEYMPRKEKSIPIPSLCWLRANCFSKLLYPFALQSLCIITVHENSYCCMPLATQVPSHYLISANVVGMCQDPTMIVLASFCCCNKWSQMIVTKHHTYIILWFQRRSNINLTGLQSGYWQSQFLLEPLRGESAPCCFQCVDATCIPGF